MTPTHQQVRPWSAAEVAYAAQGLGWPRMRIRDDVIEGERDWRDVLALADPGLVSALHAALVEYEAAAEADPQ